MSLLNKASLIQIPSGYKDGTLYSAKPTNGDGDFTFSRGSNLAATRVNSDGLIEKGRENLYTYSQQIDNAVWSKARGSVTANAIAAPDGTTTADLFTENTATGTHDIRQGLTSTSGKVYTFSIHAKSNGRPRLDVYVAGPNKTGNFDLSTGSIVGGSAIDKKIESLGGGWYRCSVCVQAVSTSTNAIWILNNGTTQNYTGDGTSGMYFWGVQAEAGLIATDYIETGASTAQAGILEDMPRLDYSGGALCPSLLLEPQRSNLLPQSEYFDGWSIKSGATATSNSIISPEGLQNASTISATNALTNYIGQNYTFSASTKYSYSVFVKNGTSSKMRLQVYDSSQYSTIEFDQSDSITYSVNLDSYDFVDYGNGWRRVIITFTTSAGAGSGYVQIYPDRNGNNEYLYAYGAMLEEGGYPTSYIPTYGGASVTRGANYMSVTPTDLLGSTTGSWFMELDDMTFEITGTSVPTIYLGDDLSNCLALEARASGQNKTIYLVKEESGTVTTLHSFTISGTTKFCFVWDGTTLKVFVDGVEEYSSTSFTQPTNWDTFVYNHTGREAFSEINSVLLFPTALTDDEAIALTTI